jgi:hypothetical protein
VHIIQKRSLFSFSLTPAKAKLRAYPARHTRSSSLFGNLQSKQRTEQYPTYTIDKILIFFLKQSATVGTWTLANPRQQSSQEKSVHKRYGITDPSTDLAIEFEREAIGVAREDAHEAPRQIGEVVVLPAPGW